MVLQPNTRLSPVHFDIRKLSEYQFKKNCSFWSWLLLSSNKRHNDARECLLINRLRSWNKHWYRLAKLHSDPSWLLHPCQLHLQGLNRKSLGFGNSYHRLGSEILNLFELDLPKSLHNYASQVQHTERCSRKHWLDTIHMWSVLNYDDNFSDLRNPNSISD